MTIRVLALTATAWFVLGSVDIGLPWSEEGVKLFLEKAIDSLNKPLRQFYEDREHSIVETASDPTIFPPRLLFEVDRLEPFPFADLPIDRKLAVRKYGEEALEESGDLPWRLIESYHALTEAFKSSDYDAAVLHSAEIAHYVGAMYVPVNVSKDGDGEPTGQHGLRERFDSRLVEFYANKIDVDTPSALYLDYPEEYAISIPRKSYIWVDNLLYFDYLSRLGVKSYDRFYYEGMFLRAEPLLEELLEGAALDTGCFWYTAWVAARRPELPKK